jgi:hypothetical protein
LIFQCIYNVLRNDRCNGRGGGVLLAVKPHLTPTRLHHLEADAEIIWCEFHCNGQKILLGSAYRSPSNSDVDNNSLLKSLNLAATECDKYDMCFLTGDFKLRVDWLPDVPCPNDNLANTFLSAFYDFVPHQLVNSPTRVVGDKSSLLDLFM